MNAISSSFVRDQSVIDREHLRLLAIFHFVAAGMAFLGLLFILGHYAMFTFVFSNPEFWAKAPKGAGPPPEFFVQLLRGFYVFFGSWCVLSGVINLLSAVFMRRLQHRTFSMIVAGFNCLHIPLGTILGVFTLVVLGRDSVARAYASASAVQPPSST